MQNTKIKEILSQNDRKGERAIAILQGLMAFTVFLLHVFTASKNNWETFSFLTILIAASILAASLLRERASHASELNDVYSHGLTIVDGILIYALILSYNHAYNLPLETTFKTPAVIFLVLYTVARILRSDPWAIIVAGSTVLVCWLGIFGIIMLNSPNVTTSYAEYVTSEKLLVGAVFELAAGYAALILILSLYAKNARHFVTKTAHIEDLALANLKAEDNILIFEELLNSSVDGVVIVDQKGTIDRANPAIEALFGFEERELLDQNVSILMTRDNATLLGGAVKSYLETQQSDLIGHSFASRGLKKDGTEFDIELSISEFTASGKSCFAGFIRDITERKTVEEQLLKAKNDAEVATRAKTSFLAMMSHEIRTPLNGVLGIHGLLKETRLNEDQQQLLSTASQSGQSLLAIINDLLDFSKLEAGKFDIDEKPFNLKELTTSVVNLIQPHADEKQLKLNCKIDDAIAENLMGDPDRIRQIILNLVWNAIKFTDSGSVTLEMTQRGGDKISFCVKDTGIGIAQEKHKDVFAEFSTIDANYSAKFGGTGLGLAICKALVDNMNGEIGFESSLGKGSSFWFNLELEKSLLLPQENLPDEPINFSSINFSGLNVLIAEDNKTNQLVTSRYLYNLGCSVEIADNGKEAVDKALAQKYDLILMDISMPEMDGFEATQAILKNHANPCPIIALTAYAGKDDKDKIIKAGMDDFIPKPFRKEELAQTIHDVISKKDKTSDVQATSVPIAKLPFDLDILDTIMEDMYAEDVRVIFSEFNNDLQRYLTIASSGIEAKDEALLEKASHGLQGVSGMFGAQELARLAQEVNHKCLSENSDDLYNQAALLINKAQEIINSCDDAEAHYLRKSGSST